MKLMYRVVTYLMLFYELINCEIQDEHNVMNEITTITTKIEKLELPLESAMQENTRIELDNEGEEDEQSVQEVQMIERKIQREDHNMCYHVDTKEYCFEKNRNYSGCDCEEIDDGNVVCCNVTDIVKSISCVAITLKNVHIINMMEKELNLTLLNARFKQTLSLSITDGNITNITGSFSKFTDIKCLSVANNKIETIGDKAFIHMTQLRTLNLSQNNITKLPTTNNHTNLTVNVQGNNKISCINISTAIDRNVKFVNKENSFCERETIYTWFNDTASVNFLALEKMKKLNEECPLQCKCEPSQLYYRNNTLEVTAKVDCSSQNLKNFPTEMPSETVELILTNNSISSLTVLIQNKNYENVQRLFIDGNKISSIEELDGTRFFGNFTILSLKNNKIKEIPNYILSNLEKNLNSGKILYLGGNHLTCDCQTFQNIRYWRLISDGNEIFCNNLEQQRVMDLKAEKMCTSSEHDWTTIINIVIGVEILLLIALFSKVSYDYYMFKKKGFLPYPASFIILYNQK